MFYKKGVGHRGYDVVGRKKHIRDVKGFLYSFWLGKVIQPLVLQGPNMLWKLKARNKFNLARTSTIN